MEQLKYVIEDKIIAKLLGENNFINKESAILELVKNSFDAKATKSEIIFSNNSISIIDNGIGMNSEDIRRHWMYIGNSTKEYSVSDLEGNERVLAGSKGIGRFALSRLGENISLSSQKNKKTNLGVMWNTDWSTSTLEEIENSNISGTKIVIKKLRDKWNKVDIDNLNDYLSKLYNDNLMEISITHDGKSIEPKEYFSKSILGINSVSKINLMYNSNNMILKCSVISDEFKEEAQKYCESKININNVEEDINILEELNKKYSHLDENEFKNYLKRVGDFSAEFYFSLADSNTNDMEKFLYKYKNLPERYSPGVILYRNSFGISTYEGVKDWLELGKRSRISPAAASHPTGSWRVRENQLSGKVIIDKKENENLVELSNRQGLEENNYYKIFIDIVQTGIAEFERYRQTIIRSINKKNEKKEENKDLIVDDIIKNKKSLKDLSKEDEEKLITEVKEFKRERSDYKKDKEETEKRFKYDIRILNVLATSGLKATSIAHEMYNDRSTIEDIYGYIIKALKDYKLWDILNEEDKTKYAYGNVPELLSKNKDINKKIVIFMNTLLKEVEKEQFIEKECNMNSLFSEIKTIWERDYSWIAISTNIIGLEKFVIAEDKIRVIFDNLILNTIQQNESMDHLNINIIVNISSNILDIVYKDNGKGLDLKYKNNPNKILEVHESSRKNGHGLGMWIVNNTVITSNGEILNIEGNDGFKIAFTLGGNK